MNDTIWPHREKFPRCTPLEFIYYYIKLFFVSVAFCSCWKRVSRVQTRAGVDMCTVYPYPIDPPFVFSMPFISLGNYCPQCIDRAHSQDQAQFVKCHQVHTSRYVSSNKETRLGCTWQKGEFHCRPTRRRPHRAQPPFSGTRGTVWSKEPLRLTWVNKRK